MSEEEIRIRIINVLALEETNKLRAMSLIQNPGNGGNPAIERIGRRIIILFK